MYIYIYIHIIKEIAPKRIRLNSHTESLTSPSIYTNDRESITPALTANSILNDDTLNYLQLHCNRWPARARINKTWWYRKYSETNKRFYWRTKSNMSWNPWYENGITAPFDSDQGLFHRFCDDNEKYYWINFKTGQSERNKPNDDICAIEIPDNILECLDKFIKKKKLEENKYSCDK
ncbi:hypothetical protein RFI_02124 [Reticulomyxa filosa]|uniref:Uncharacterized protein n=1 Tax=Reticulomyxa filosa TaxID=46433 RepID=X6P8V3_RETFI|nr:hypothetical protein RFI_02124 [Reticulomyxa filosa]|eukprot:ETO34950.1 hypothetical protein RFI_02124 [Reticulomyxa filosa]